ncbi:pseudouridine-5'-phosphate glycosidase family protein [Sporobolomyces salmoneus]|uniref:pseudouridine-5'-phosphate glycosidase family protein n=1 Tax=Sporobolomyces salmoneus TaxID=183962 RepID=UPI00317D4D53
MSCLLRATPRRRLVTPTARSFTSTASSGFLARNRPSLSSLPIDISPEVQQAQAEGRPIVALESTLITHGLPPPHSASLPNECEAILREQNVTPATVALLGGRIKVGLTPQDLDLLAEKGWAARQGDKADKDRLWKVGRRELGAALVKGLDGGTTVSGTMAVAHLAGIKVFSTGGIGGVHRGAETSFDISSDLISLSDTPVVVVCAGSKSILDIGLTLEYLEAHAVPVAGYKTDHWPAFYTAESGFKAPMRLDSALEVARAIRMTDKLQLPSSLLLGNPIPEAYHAVGEELQEAVQVAVAESVENGMSKRGKEVTPWLLQRVAELTQGRSLESNKELIRNNVRVGGLVATEYAKLLKEEEQGSPASSFMPSSPLQTRIDPSSTSATTTPSRIPATPLSTASLAVVGSLAVDITMHPFSSSPLQTTAPGTVSLTLGGVAGNVARAAHSILNDERTLLIAPIGEDLLGSVAEKGLKDKGMRTDGLIRPTSESGEETEARTATCGYLVDEKGELIGGVADMKIAREVEGQQIVNKLKQAQAKVVAFDGNLSPESMARVLVHCGQFDILTFFEPTSNANSLKLLTALQQPLITSLPPTGHPLVTYSTPNIHELQTLFQNVAFSDSSIFEPGQWFDGITVSADQLSLRLPSWVVNEGVAQMAVRLLPIIGTLFVKSGSKGVLVVQRVSGVDRVSRWKQLRPVKGTVVVGSSATPSEAVVIRHYSALTLDENEMGSVTGAGDSLAGATLAALVSNLDPIVPSELDKIVDLAQRAAINTLKSREAVGDHSHLRKLLAERQ